MCLGLFSDGFGSAQPLICSISTSVIEPWNDGRAFSRLVTCSTYAGVRSKREARSGSSDNESSFELSHLLRANDTKGS